MSKFFPKNIQDSKNNSKYIKDKLSTINEDINFDKLKVEEEKFD